MTTQHTRSNTDWLHDAKWGVFIHYLAGLAGGFNEDVGQNISSEDWNKRVDSFDVDALARQLSDVNAGYICVTLGQNSGHFCAPNAAYDSIVGIQPSKLSRRDLVADLYEVLEPRGIKLMVYAPSGSPCEDPVAIEKLEWKWGFEGEFDPSLPWYQQKRTMDRLDSFQRKWESVLREWSLRWGTKVKGWWIDGCYFSDEMYRFPAPPNFKSFAEAMKAGNPDSIVAFNPGVFAPIITMSEYEDYTAGEINAEFPKHTGRWLDGEQYHILSFLGANWGNGEPRFCDEFVYGYTKEVILGDGVITWDVRCHYDGTIVPSFLRQLESLKDLR